MSMTALLSSKVFWSRTRQNRLKSIEASAYLTYIRYLLQWPINLFIVLQNSVALPKKLYNPCTTAKYPPNIVNHLWSKSTVHSILNWPPIWRGEVGWLSKSTISEVRSSQPPTVVVQPRAGQLSSIVSTFPNSVHLVEEGPHSCWSCTLENVVEK